MTFRPQLDQHRRRRRPATAAADDEAEDDDHDEDDEDDGRGVATCPCWCQEPSLTTRLRRRPSRVETSRALWSVMVGSKSVPNTVMASGVYHTSQDGA